MGTCKGWHMLPPDLMLCWGTVAATNVVELIDAAAANGFNAISVSPRLYAATKDAGITDAAMRDALDDAAVTVAVIEPLLSGLPGALTPKTAPPEMANLFAFTDSYCFDMADALGATRVSLSHFLGQPVPVEAMIDGVGAIVARARARDITTCIEFIPDSGLGDLPTACAIYVAVGRDRFGIMLDAWHFARSGGTLPDLDGAPPGAITVLQLCDRVEPAPGAAYVPMAGRLLPGAGELPLVDLTRRVVQDHPDVLIGVEVFSADLQALDPTEAALLAATATRDVLAKV